MSLILSRDNVIVTLYGVPRCLEDEPSYDDAANAYEASDDFVTDALQWVADARDLPGDLVDKVLRHYRESPAFVAAVEDVQVGER